MKKICFGLKGEQNELILNAQHNTRGQKNSWVIRDAPKILWRKNHDSLFFSTPDGSKIYEAKKSEKHDLYKSRVILNLTNAPATCFRDVSIFYVLASSSNVKVADRKKI